MKTKINLLKLSNLPGNIIRSIVPAISGTIIINISTQPFNAQFIAKTDKPAKHLRRRRL